MHKDGWERISWSSMRYSFEMIELMWYRTEKNTIMLNSQRKRRAGSGIFGDCLFHGPRIQKLAQDLKSTSGSQSCHASYAEDYENIRHSEREECNLSSWYESLNVCGDIWMVEKDFGWKMLEGWASCDILCTRHHKMRVDITSTLKRNR